MLESVALRRVLLGIALFLGSVVILATSWTCFSFIIFVGASLLVVADPSMEASGVLALSLVGGAVATIFSCAMSALDKLVSRQGPC
jgi:hypothetical protein